MLMDDMYPSSFLEANRARNTVVGDECVRAQTTAEEVVLSR
jgi:hypothetical protein